MYKSVKNILLSFVLILGTIGTMGNAHICNGVLKAINMAPSHECCAMGMDMKMKTDCCENNAHHIKIEGHFDHVIDIVEVPSFTYQEMMRNLWESAFVFIQPSMDTISIISVAQTDHSIYSSPPIYREVPINITNQVILV